MVKRSNVEGLKPTTVEDLIQLLATQQRLQQEKCFEMVSTFLTALQASVPVRQQQEAAMPQTTPKFEAFDSTVLQNCGQITGSISLFLQMQIQCLMRELLKFFLQIKRQLSTSCLLLRKPRQEQ